MAFGLDYIKGPPIAALKKEGVTFVCRYLSEVNEQTKIKLLTPEEAKTNSQAGISIVSNYEWYASRATEGHASGVYDAQIAAKQHTDCGGPADRPIYFSVDEDVDGSQCAGYFQGVASVIDLPRTGAYGSYRVLKYLFDHKLITWGWQTYAWSYGVWEPRAHIQQYQNGVMLAGASVDYNRSMRDDFGQWRIGATMLDIKEVSTYFEEVTPDKAWRCKKYNTLLAFGMLGYFRRTPHPLASIGLPRTGEISVPGNPGIKIQVFERCILAYDPDNVLDNPPDAEDVYALHIDSINSPAYEALIQVVPELKQPEPARPAIDTTAAESAIHAMVDGLAPLAARALVEVQKLRQ